MKVRIGIRAGLSTELLPVHLVYFAPFVETNRDFQNEEKVVANAADARHDLGNPVGLSEGFVDGVAQLSNQTFKIIVKLQVSPGSTLPASELNSRVGVGARQDESAEQIVST